MPKRISAAAVILWIQFAAAAMLEIVALVTIGHKASQGFWLGVQERLAAGAGASSLAEYGPSHAGRITGLTAIAFVLLLVSLWSIRRRQFWPIFTCTCLLILASLGQQSLPLFSLVVLALVSFGQGRAWLKRRDV